MDRPGRPRSVRRSLVPQPVREGAGVRVLRSFPTRTLDDLDPFLLLDNFQATDPADYQAGFPMHPHRGIETVTYVLAGAVRHRDTLGSSGTIGAGDVQWMTSGRGILHEEMPLVRPEGIAGFQLWVNLPARLKMTRPRYQDVPARSIPEIETDGGVRIRVIAGRVGEVEGAVKDIAADPTYLDITMPPRSTMSQPILAGHTAFLYLFDGSMSAGGEHGTETPLAAPALAVLDDGDRLVASTTGTPAHFLLVSGKPLGEPIARHGPFVMNTQEEIEQTLEDLRQGTFLRPDRG